MNAPALEIRDVSKHFNEIEVLRNISLTVEKGRTVSILGASGSGKSTLLRCVNWLEKPTRGEIFLSGRRIGIDPVTNKEMGDAALSLIRARIGMVFQGFNLWPHMTVRQNVEAAPLSVLGLSRAEARELADDLLAKVGLAEKRDAWPHALSGGQKQRVGIARALAMSPEVMLFDEPTSALDPELVGEVLAVMRALAEEGMTMIVVTHEMTFARDVSDEIVFLDKAVLVERAPPSEFFGAPRTERARKFLARMA
jgi:polar amino acid transport system ATP-binding protein